jgi:exonuclease III
MIGIIWNCQGLRKQGKIEFLKELICDEKADFISLQETMKKNFSQSWLDAISGGKKFIWIHSIPRGRSGGLLVGFNSDCFDVREQEVGDFMIRCLVLHKEKNFIWNFINVYGAAQEHEKNKFLCELSSFCHRSKHPMLLGGDFNIIRRDEEKNKPGG